MLAYQPYDQHAVDGPRFLMVVISILDGDIRCASRGAVGTVGIGTAASARPEIVRGIIDFQI